MVDYSQFMRIARTVVALLVALLFFLLGGMKWLGIPIHGLEIWSYPKWFLIVVGTIEIIAGALLILHPTRLLGVGLGLSILLGASLTHMSHGQWVEVVGTCVVGTLLMGIAWLHTLNAT